jgi:hypothetical protein
VLAQVEPVGNLYGVGGAASAGIGVGFGSITDKDLDARMCLQPGDEWLSFACLQHVDRRVSFQVDEQRAIRLAVVVIYHVLRTGRPYDELGMDYFDHLHAARIERHHVRRLEQLGYTVTLTPAAA